jgi:glycosyltransferase involved in cell wall biosynthesis
MTMTNSTLKVAIVTNVLPSYREGFYDRVFARDDVSVHVYCQAEIPGVNLRTIHAKYPGRVTVVKYFSMRGERLAWQFIPWREVISGSDVVFVDGNPRLLSHAGLATALRMLRRPVVLWAGAHSYRNNAFRERIRLLWTRMFDHVFLYTDAEVDRLRRRGFTRHHLTAMNNGLDQRKIDGVMAQWTPARLDAWRGAENLVGRQLLLTCARLIRKNEFRLLAEALQSIRNRVPEVLWVAVGDGPERQSLESMVRDRQLDEHVRFAGEIYDESRLAPWFLSSTLFVQPAAIGLGLLHAFGYGLPVVTHGNPEAHGPEFAAFEPGLTGLTFAPGDVRGLSHAVTGLLLDEAARTRMGEFVRQIAREKYNVDVMVERFVQMARSAANGRA